MNLSDLLNMGFVYQCDWGKDTKLYYNPKMYRYAKVDSLGRAEIFERGEG